jgi:hypothetical protein
MVREVVHGYQTHTFDNALKVVEQNKDLPKEQQFVWTAPGWPMKKMLEDWEGQNTNFSFLQCRYNLSFRKLPFFHNSIFKVNIQFRR